MLRRWHPGAPPGPRIALPAVLPAAGKLQMERSRLLLLSGFGVEMQSSVAESLRLAPNRKTEALKTSL